MAPSRTRAIGLFVLSPNTSPFHRKPTDLGDLRRSHLLSNNVTVLDSAVVLRTPNRLLAVSEALVKGPPMLLLGNQNTGL